MYCRERWKFSNLRMESLKFNPWGVEVWKSLHVAKQRAFHYSTLHSWPMVSKLISLLVLGSCDCSGSRFGRRTTAGGRGGWDQCHIPGTTIWVRNPMRDPHRISQDAYGSIGSNMHDDWWLTSPSCKTTKLLKHKFGRSRLIHRCRMTS